MRIEVCEIGWKHASLAHEDSAGVDSVGLAWIGVTHGGGAACDQVARLTSLPGACLVRNRHDIPDPHSGVVYGVAVVGPCLTMWLCATPIRGLPRHLVGY